MAEQGRRGPRRWRGLVALVEPLVLLGFHSLLQALCDLRRMATKKLDRVADLPTRRDALAWIPIILCFCTWLPTPEPCHNHDILNSASMRHCTLFLAATVVDCLDI